MSGSFRLWGVDFRCLLVVAAAIVWQTGVAQLAVRPVGSAAVFSDPSNIVVRLTSDLTIEVQCMAENGMEMEIMWSQNGIAVPSGLQAFGVSQGGNGVLRVHPAQLIQEAGRNQFVCSTNTGIAQNVTFTLADELFFPSPPPSLVMGDIPPVSSTREQEDSSIFNTVQETRGVHQSASIQAPTFRYEPSQSMVQPTNRFSIAAFACAVLNPSNISVSFQWHFRQTNSPSSSPLMDGGRISIVDAREGSSPRLSDPSTSVLILENVTAEDMGAYFCQVEFCCGSLNSSEAQLIIIPGELTSPTIVLFPISISGTVVAGENFTIPCVTSDLSVPMVELNNVPVTSVIEVGATVVLEAGQQTLECTAPGGIRSVTITAEDRMDAAVFSVMVGGVSVPQTQELVVREGESVELACSPNGRLLANGTDIGTPFQAPSVGRDQTGFYQCLSTGAVDSLYLLVTYVDPPIIAPPTQLEPYPSDSTLVLSCSSEGSPIPRLSWSIDPQVPLDATQAPTGFREAAMSGVSINVSSLSVSEYTVTCRSEVNVTDFSLINSTTFLFSIFLENITLSSSFGAMVVLRIANENLSLVCSVQANVVPSFTFSRNGVETSSAVTSIGTTHQSTLVINTSSLSPGTEHVTCTAQLGIADTPSLSTILYIIVGVVFENISVFPVEVTVNSTQGQDSLNLTCGVQAARLPVITWTREGGAELTGTAATRAGESLLVESVLVVNLQEVRGEAVFTCTAALEGVAANMSANATITRNIPPSFRVNPDGITTVAGDNVTLVCGAEGFPAPSIVWEDGDGGPILDDSVFDISFQAFSLFEASSSLTFSPSERDNRTSNGSTFHCVASNLVGLRTLSELAEIIIAGPPEPPEGLRVTDLTSSSVELEWSPPFSLVSLTGYQLTIFLTRSSAGMELSQFVANLEPNVLVFRNSSLEPFSSYRVELVALNRAGNGTAAAVNFETLQAVPGPPVNIRSSAPSLNVIIIEWDLTPLPERNGNLTMHTVRFQVQNNETDRNVSGTVSMLRLEGLFPGQSYSIQVAAHTEAGIGPFSDPPIVQFTISTPQSLVSVTGFEVNEARGDGITPTTIPVTLPAIPNVENDFSHLWLIAVKIPGGTQLPDDPLQSFPDNDSFVLFSSGSVPLMSPYILAEVSASRYEALRTNLVLGDLNTTASFNDVPLYINGPLNQSTIYTMFVWGFVPTPMNGGSTSRAKRQVSTTPMRQYSVFSSTSFLQPVSTTAIPVSSGGLSGGAIAGIVISLVIVVLLIVAIIVIGVFLYDRFRYQAELGPPPSRKGSMRLRDHNEIVRSSLRRSFRGLTLHNQKAEAALQDLNPDDARLPVSVQEFPAYVKSLHKNTDHLFSEEYGIVAIKSPSLSHIQCTLPANVPKNRYANINCYDNSRVILETEKESSSEDYINANYIDGYKLRYAYIATQGPLPNTTHDFWKMVWEQESCCIIMLTNLVEKGRLKCHQYWPEMGSVTLEDISIDLVEVQELAYYTIRTLRLTKDGTTREIKQFHYTGWPDFGVPDYPHPVLAFIRRLSRFKRTMEGPDIVHCSAGVGRTGTLIAIQAMMQMAEQEGIMDVFNFVLGMRQQRNYMVQTERQYIFIHDALLEFIQMGDTEVPMQDLRTHFKKLEAHNPQTESSGLEAEYSHLNELEDVDVSQYQPANNSINMPKNRFKHILPYDRYRVRLLLHPGVIGSDYINACYVDGYQRRHQYILTQGPMSSTVTDFWRMVWEHRCSCIMMLCQCEEGGVEQSVCYWPTDKVQQRGDMFIEQTNFSQYTGYEMREFAVTNTKINESRVIKHFQYSEWLEKKVPPNAATVIDLIGVLQKTQHMCGGGPIIVHDNTSIGRSGTFVVLSSVLEQLKVEGVIDPFATINSLRQQQPGIVSTFDQYRFCYQAVIEFLDSFDHYSNFD